MLKCLQDKVPTKTWASPTRRPRFSSLVAHTMCFAWAVHASMSGREKGYSRRQWRLIRPFLSLLTLDHLLHMTLAPVHHNFCTQCSIHRLHNLRIQHKALGLFRYTSGRKIGRARLLRACFLPHRMAFVPRPHGPCARLRIASAIIDGLTSASVIRAEYLPNFIPK